MIIYDDEKPEPKKPREEMWLGVGMRPVEGHNLSGCESMAYHYRQFGKDEAVTRQQAVAQSQRAGLTPVFYHKEG